MTRLVAAKLGCVVAVGAAIGGMLFFARRHSEAETFALLSISRQGLARMLEVNALGARCWQDESGGSLFAEIVDEIVDEKTKYVKCFRAGREVYKITSNLIDSQDQYWIDAHDNVLPLPGFVRDDKVWGRVATDMQSGLFVAIDERANRMGIGHYTNRDGFLFEVDGWPLQDIEAVDRRRYFLGLSCFRSGESIYLWWPGRAVDPALRERPKVWNCREFKLANHGQWSSVGEASIVGEGTISVDPKNARLVGLRPAIGILREKIEFVLVDLNSGSENTIGHDLGHVFFLNDKARADLKEFVEDVH